MNIEERIESFVVLGKILSEALELHNGNFTQRLNTLIENQNKRNPWFTPENVKTAVSAIASELTRENLTKWTNGYPALKENKNSK